MKALEITTCINCIMQCVYCPQSILKDAYKKTGKAIKKEMLFDDFKNILYKIPHRVNIHFSGFCEPFQNKNCIDMIEYAYGLGYEIVVYSTGYGINTDVAKRLGTIEFKNFFIHIPLSLYYQQNKYKFIEAYELLDKYRVGYKIIEVVPNAKNSAIIKDLKNNEYMLLQNEISRAGNNIRVTAEYHKGKIKCKENRHLQNVLMPNGDVYLCCNDYGLEHKLGNLLVQDYNDIIKSDELKKIKEGFLKDSIYTLCRQCERAI